MSATVTFKNIGVGIFSFVYWKNDEVSKTHKDFIIYQLEKSDQPEKLEKFDMFRGLDPGVPTVELPGTSLHISFFKIIISIINLFFNCKTKDRTTRGTQNNYRERGDVYVSFTHQVFKCV